MLTAEEKKIVRRIRRMVKETFWIKGSYRRLGQKIGSEHMYCYCLVGLINHCTDGRQVHSLNTPIYKLSKSKVKIIKAIQKELLDPRFPGDTPAIEAWNDRANTIREDVINVLSRVLEAE